MGVALAASSVVPAHAQPEGPPDVAHARELFVQGTEQRDAGDARGALEKLKAAHDLAPNPITAVELGRTYAMLGMLLEAREAFLSVARLPVQPDETARSTKARQDAAELADDAKQEIDRVVASVQATRDLATASPTPAGPPAATTGAPSAEESRGLGPMAYVGFGVGVVGFVTGGILAALTISKAADAQNACSGGSCNASMAGDDLTAARSMGYGSIVSFLLGGIGAAVGIVDLLRSPPCARDPGNAGLRVVPWIANGRAGVSGSF